MRERREQSAIEGSLRAVRAVGGVVQALWAVARAQLPRVEEAVAETTGYLDELDRLVDRIAGPRQPVPEARSLTVLLGPDRAFCGPLAHRLLAARPAEGPLGLVGTQLAERAAELPDVAPRVRFRVAGPSGVDEIDAVARALATALLEAAADAPVELLRLAPDGEGVRRQVLLGPRDAPDQGAFHLLSPAERVLEAALHDAVSGRVRIAVAEALRTEVRARIEVAERARRAIDDRRDRLELDLRLLRDERITTEIVELQAGLLERP
jgi:F0F1-type ATP synthase gamma subunit